MKLRQTLLASAIAAFVPLAADAQSAAPGKVTPLSITVQTSMFVQGSTATPDEETALQQKARALVYKMGAGECAVLAPSIEGECRLSQIQVSSRDLDRAALVRAGAAAAPDGVSVQGSFTLIVTPKQ